MLAVVCLHVLKNSDFCFVFLIGFSCYEPTPEIIIKSSAKVLMLALGKLMSPKVLIFFIKKLPLSEKSSFLIEE